MKKSLFFLSVSIFSTTLVASKIDSNKFCHQDKWISDIVQDHRESVRSINKGKLYLKSEELFFESDGIFLSGNMTPLPMICADEQGYFIPYRGLHVMCGVCGYQFEIDELTTSCPNCGHGDG